MAFSVVMPALEMAQETGKLVAWRRKEGETVAKGEPLLEVETDKAVLEVEAPADGILAGIKVLEGAVVPVGQTIAWIVRPGEVPPADVAVSAADAVTSDDRVRTPVASESQRRERSTQGGGISPKARRLAQEHGVDIARLHGSGPDGEILASDVLAAAGTQTSLSSMDIEIPGSIGRLMAERTTQSWTTVPHFFVTREAEASAFLEARERLGSEVEKTSGLRVTHTDLLIALVARVLKEHPRINASWDDQKIRLNREVNIGLAMAVDDGVVAAVIHDADKLAIGEIAARRRDLTQRARAGRLRPADIAGATFTISNLGMHHVDSFSAIISAPQAAILAVGSITDRVVPVEGKPAVRPTMTLTLSCDHRVIDGAHAAAFLNDLVEALRKPEDRLR